MSDDYEMPCFGTQTQLKTVGVLQELCVNLNE